MGAVPAASPEDRTRLRLALVPIVCIFANSREIRKETYGAGIFAKAIPLDKNRVRQTVLSGARAALSVGCVHNR